MRAGGALSSGLLAPAPATPTENPATRRARSLVVRRSRRRRVEIVLLILLVALVTAPALWVFTRDDTAGITAADRYPGTAPAEWSPGATWASPPLLEGTRAVGVGADATALVTADRSLLLVGTDGKPTWRGDLPDGTVKTAPAPARIGGRDVLAAHVGDRLVWWAIDDGDRTAIEVPAGAKVSLLGEVPLVAVGGTEVMAVTSDHPTRVQVPADVTALAAHEDGAITAAGPGGWRHLRSDGGPGSAGAWENPSPAAPTVVGYTGGFVLLVRPGNPATVEVHADRTSDVRYVFGAPIVLPGGPGASITWTPSPSGTWGILGRTLVDLRLGRAEDLGAWSTQSVTTDRAYGHIDGQSVIVGPAIGRGVLAPGEATPDVVTAAGAVVRGPAADSSGGRGTDPRRTADVAYFLPPRKAAS